MCDPEAKVTLSRGRGGSTIAFTSDYVDKYFPDASIDALAVKSTLVFETAERTGLFVAPEVLATDTKNRTIRFRRLAVGEAQHVGPRLRQAYCWSTVGASLAEIHAALDAHVENIVGDRRDFVRQLPDWLTAALRESPSAPAHGDFGLANISLTRDGDLAVFDPCPNMYSCTAVWSIEPVILDIALMASHLVGRRDPVSSLVSNSVDEDQLALFLDGYESVSGYRPTNSALGSAMRFVMTQYCFGYRSSKLANGMLVYAVFLFKKELRKIGAARRRHPLQLATKHPRPQ